MSRFGFSPLGEVFDYDQYILVALGGFWKVSHEIPSNKLKGGGNNGGLECSNGLACWFDALTQVVLFDVVRDRVSQVGPIKPYSKLFGNLVETQMA